MIVRLASEDLQRILLCLARVARLGRWNEGRDRVEPLLLQRFAVKLSLAGSCFEAAVSEGEECIFAGLRRGMPRLYVRGSRRLQDGDRVWEIQPHGVLAL